MPYLRIEYPSHPYFYPSRRNGKAGRQIGDHQSSIGSTGDIHIQRQAFIKIIMS